MKQIIEKNKRTLIILGLFLLAVMGMTLAYYNSKKDFKNEFRTPKPGVAIHEVFNPTDYWVPGEEKSKEAWFSNSGEIDMLLRFKVDVAWAEGVKHPKRDPNEFVTLYWKSSKLGSDNKVKLSEAGGKEDFDFELGPDGYYYYKKVLEAEGSNMAVTQNVLESVEFSNELSNDGHKNSDYSNVQVNVTIKGETVLASAEGAAALAEWQTSVAAVKIDDQKNVEWTFKQAKEKDRLPSGETKNEGLK